MAQQFFVMLNCQNNSYLTPLVSGYNEEVVLFDTEDQARQAAEENLLGFTFGYEVFERGSGL